MRTNKIAILAVCLALLASCKKDNNTDDNAPENGFRATIVQPAKDGGSGERTHINPNWNNPETSVFWTENDLIKVANQNGSGTALTFGLAEGKNTMSGTFYTGEPHDDFFVPDYVAIYPAANTKGVANTISGTTATFNIPSTQIRQNKSFGEGAMPMVACSSTQTLDFYNVFGGLCIPLNSGVTVDSIRLTSLDPDDRLWGVFTVDCSSTNPMPTHVSGGSNSVTLVCNSVFVNANTSDFYIMVPPGTLESGFTITIYKGAAAIYEESVDWTASPVAGFIPRSVIKKVNHKLSVIQVTTKSPTFITSSSAYTGGTASGAPTEYGMLYALADDLSSQTSYEGFMEDAKANLRIDNASVNKINGSFTSSSTSGNFNTEAMTGLAKDRVYVVRAYATNSDGTAFYGEPIPFATRKDYANDYGGMIPYAYSISPTRQVNFSMGNLQWSATGGGSAPTTHATAAGTTAAGTWRFAEYQFEFVGNASNGLVYTGGMFPSGNVGVKCNNALIDENYTGWIDLFGYGTSGCNHGAVAYQPWAASAAYADYFAYGQNTANLYDGNGYADWGVYNAISNGGNLPGLWYTLSHNIADLSASPWYYLLCLRAASTVNGKANVRYFYMGVSFRNDVRQVPQVILPDNFTWPSTYVNSYPNSVNDEPVTLNVSNVTMCNNSQNQRWTEAEWSLLEWQGAVILPQIGFRSGTSAYYTSSYYHSSTSGTGGSSANNYKIQPRSSAGLISLTQKNSGCGVRLVRDAN